MVTTGVGIDLEEVVWVAGQAVGDGVAGGVQIEGVGGDANCRANSNILIDLVYSRVGIGWRGDVELIEIIDRDVERLIRRGPIAGLGLDGDRAIWPCVSRSIATAVVTTPVLGSIWKRLSGLLVRL